MPKKAKVVAKYDPKVGLDNVKFVGSFFRTHAIGPEDGMHLSHLQFRTLSAELHLGSVGLSDRLFAALDDDNTGAMNVHEFFQGMHAMHDSPLGSPKQLQLAYNMFNSDRSPASSNSINDTELREFMDSFYKEACNLTSGWVRRWIDQFENMFGERVAATRVRGRDHQLDWRDTPAAQQADAKYADQARRASAQFSRQVLDFTERVRKQRANSGGAVAKKTKTKKGEKEAEEEIEPDDGLSMGAQGFNAWCGLQLSDATLDPSIKLNVLSWLEKLGDTWLERMKLPALQRQLSAMQPTTIGFTVARKAGAAGVLKKRFQAVNLQQLQRVRSLLLPALSNALQGSDGFPLCAPHHHAGLC